MVIDTSIGQQSFSPTSWLESRVEGKRRWCMVADAPEMQCKYTGAKGALVRLELLRLDSVWRQWMRGYMHQSGYNLVVAPGACWALIVANGGASHCGHVVETMIA